MKMRWFCLLMCLFPRSERLNRGDEILDALSESESNTWQAVKESRSLIWAGSIAWRRYLRSTDGLWRSAYVGAVLWFGALLAIGPLLRLRFTLQFGSNVPGSQAGPLPYVVAIAFCLLAVALVRRSRWAAALVGCVGIGAAAGSNVIGTWGIVESAWFEARWLGVPLALVVAVGARAGTNRALPVWFPLTGLLAVACAVMAIPLDAYASHASRNYAIMLQWNLWPSFHQHFAHGGWEWLMVAVVIGMLVALFVHPMPSALATVPILHLVAVDPRIGVTLGLLVGVARMWRPLLERIDVRVSWRRQ